MIVLDSWAVLAWLDGEQPAFDAVEAVIADRPTMSWMNIVEVSYRLQRNHGKTVADRTVADLRRAIDADLPGTGRMLAAADLKARYAMALADCFAVATAAAIGAELWTGDPEIIGAAGLPCTVRDLR